MSTETPVPATPTTTETPTTTATTDSLLGAATESAAAAKAPETPVAPLTAEALTFPEGFTTDPAVTGKFVDLANELKISPEGANKLVALQAELEKARSEQNMKVFQDTQKQWQDQVRADPAIGGQNLEKNIAEINKLITSHGDADLREALAFTGAGNSLPVIRFLTKIAKELNEATPVSGQPAGRVADGGLAEKLYPSQPTA